MLQLWHALPWLKVGNVGVNVLYNQSFNLPFSLMHLRGPPHSRYPCMKDSNSGKEPELVRRQEGLSPLLGNNLGVTPPFIGRSKNLDSFSFVALLHLSCVRVQSWKPTVDTVSTFPNVNNLFRIFIKYRRNAENIIRSNMSQLLNQSTFVRF